MRTTCIRCGGEGLFGETNITCDICLLAIEEGLEKNGADRTGYQVPVGGKWPVSQYDRLIFECLARKIKR